jgi:hypothetical protein
MPRPSLLIVVVSLATISAQSLAQPGLQSFVPVTPCRLVDTRINQGGSTLPANSTRRFTVGGVCGVPLSASAYSLNVTVIPQGSLFYLTIWPAGQAQPTVSTLNDAAGLIMANAAVVPAGISGAATLGKVDVFVTDNTDLILDINGYFAPPSVVPSGAANNLAVGATALHRAFDPTLTMTGTANTAIGAGALFDNSSGSNNTSLGVASLLQNFNGGNNTAIGVSALTKATSASNNIAVGHGSLSMLTGGNGNIAIGENAGIQLESGINNIYLGTTAPGTSFTLNEFNVMRLGQVQTSTFIAGINGANIGAGATVLINANGQLGTVISSERYKEDIHDMGRASESLMRLRPVSFRYKQTGADGGKPLSFGLIAEEVAKVYPELVVRDSTGRAESVQYHQLPALLLNELQKQHRTIETQRAEIRVLESRLDALETLIASRTPKVERPR